MYIGESSDIRGRLFHLRNAMGKFASTGHQGPPHWAGGCAVQKERDGAVLEVSWIVQPNATEDELKGLEYEYIAAHRWFTGANPECQFTALRRRKGK